MYILSISINFAVSKSTDEKKCGSLSLFSQRQCWDFMTFSKNIPCATTQCSRYCFSTHCSVHYSLCRFSYCRAWELPTTPTRFTLRHGFGTNSCLSSKSSHRTLLVDFRLLCHQAPTHYNRRTGQRYPPGSDSDGCHAGVRRIA